ncbi:MAG: AAA family ATPase [Dolichospermum sp. DET50]|nr:AAA family ATPase [Dolichospermum sp. DET66]MBS3033027.1 AAA family ATPase [Dolichospermum sp. DET67]MBS3038232.1 AAA family ATPase [Dolichospermum sp. DET50]QSX70130.1 MAG: AAA family ATPase [Dolichospermum sp. DET69]
MTENDEQELNKLLAKPDSELIKDILEYNQISSFVLSGVLTVSLRNESLGYFKSVLDHNGREIKYPNGDDLDDIFIYDPYELEKGERYYFECELASLNEKKKRNNPYLLKTTVDRVQQGEKLNSLVKAIKEKNDQINELNEIIKDYEETITQKITEISKNDGFISELSEKIESNKIQLDQIINQKTEMENTIKILQQKINICRNLEFLSEDEERQYISLSREKYVIPNNYLSFDNELENNFSQLADHVHQYLFHQKNLIYTRFQIRNFLTLLRTNDLIVLSGLSGSGKTQIVKAFAEALGGVAKIIPVKPNWTSSDDLLGYYNPIQMSFLPTPFTEAIVEAIHNPDQLYLICLDEMNLARVEYYFADFLSKLEERSNQPEIELYAKHEEELFISEFKTLLNLLENSAKDIEIKSWQDFLNNDKARTRFLEIFGNNEKESLLQLHTKTKRRLMDILKFPSTIKIPNNVRFIGAINVDETTNYFSPKILDRVHIVKFENPLLYEEKVRRFLENSEYDLKLAPVYVNPVVFSQREEYPKMDDSYISRNLKEINEKFLLPLNIDFGVRSIRQSLNYAKFNHQVYENYANNDKISLNIIIIQKVLPRFSFDSSKISQNGSSKLEILELLISHLKTLFKDYYHKTDGSEEIGKVSHDFLSEMIKNAKNNPQIDSEINFFA